MKKIKAIFKNLREKISEIKETKRSQFIVWNLFNY